ncbi:MAG: restriction endonuclease subunit M [Prevotella sp.]|nr:restriction endonuclease subunit M [Prevotella sp.]
MAKNCNSVACCADSGVQRDNSQIKSKERVAERGEVFTAEREVNAMLDLVADECLRPDSRFLEPACGDGNFLVAILRRKLTELRRKYKKSSRDYEKMAIVAIGSLYGVDIMNDNVLACRERLFSIWNEEYTAHCDGDASDEAREVARFIIGRNIVNGNALTLKCVDADGHDTNAPIVFSEWTLIGGTQMQRSDYTMDDLLLYNDCGSKNEEGNLFALTEEQKEEGGIFLRRYITHYKKVQDYGE